jgi:hypothetical protein
MPRFSGDQARQAVEHDSEDRLIGGARRQMDFDLLFSVRRRGRSMPVALLDHAVEGYLAFRKDTGDRLKATLVGEPNSVRGQCLRGYLLMLFGQRAMVSRTQRSLDAAQAAARSV